MARPGEVMIMDKALALITGASAGIGEALADCFARHGHDVALVARRAELLEALAERLCSQHGVAAHVFVQDLSEPGAAAELSDQVRNAGIDVGILVNNAGIAWSGAFKAMPAGELEVMLRVNIEALSLLCAAFLPAMLAQGYGRILNVASVAAFQPLPSMAAYAASKAYVLALGEALDEELHGSGVRVTTLCPGVTDTGSAVIRDRLAALGLPLPAFLTSSAAEVAAEGYAACMAGDTLRVPGLANRIGALLSQTQPRAVLRTLAGVVGRQLMRH